MSRNYHDYCKLVNIELAKIEMWNVLYQNLINTKDKQQQMMKITDQYKFVKV